jgi:hypothetical protein
MQSVAPLIIRVGLGIALAGIGTAVPSRAATVVETQRITVTPPKPIEGSPPAIPSPTPELHKAGDELPAPVAAMRKKLLDAAYTGDMESLRAVIQQTQPAPAFSVNEIADPVQYLKSQSGDGNGLELLAIMTDLLESGWAHIDVGTPQEMYVWPYFAVLPMNKLTPPQLVDVYKIVTSSDFEEMRSTGIYSFYAIGIGKDGVWKYFKLNN